MRILAAPMLALFAACAVAPPPAPAPAPAAPAAPVTETAPADPHGMTIDEEAQILRLEDRREFDAPTIEAWLRHPNSLHRLRIAQAIGRIGPHARSGVAQLATLVSDPDRRV
ncbi:MAG TPA: hypothetical protein VFO89_13190, partial [Thermoanaerobaculia bacterium]|nr:hypothetical protein [Thermoanaerobaculia bacterium]